MDKKDCLTLQSQTFDWLRFPLIVCVVFIHNPCRPALNFEEIVSGSFSMMSCYNLIRVVLTYVLTHIAVPAFYVISGYLFFYNTRIWNFDIYKTKIKKRFHTLIIPYILWNVIAYALLFGVVLVKNICTGDWNGDFSLSLDIFWNYYSWKSGYDWLGNEIVHTAPINLPLWFLRDLIVLSILSPLLYWLVTRFKYYFIAILFFLYISGFSFQISGFDVTALFFFCLGAYFSINGLCILQFTKRIPYIPWIAAILLMLTVLYGWKSSMTGSLIYPFYIITGVISAFGLSSCLLRSGKVTVNHFLTSSVFFIYAIHTVNGMNMCNLDSIYLGNNPLILLPVYLITPIIKIAVGLGIFWLMKRYTPKILGFLIGER